MSDRTTHQLRTLSTGLVAYGVVGIVMAVIMLGAVVAIGSRLDGIAAKMSSRLTTISATVDRTATALEHAGTTSQSFAGTLDQAGPTLAQVDTALTDVVSTLQELQTTSGALTFLGQQPLASLSGRFGQIATQLGTLQIQVGTLGANLGDNKTNLVALGGGLTDLAGQLRQVNDVLGSGEIESSLSDIVTVVRAALALLAVWFAVPAVAALGFGIWIRRQVRVDPSPPAAAAA
jgi:septal ring factor EnvC (AmiA/AmiB activator)